MLFSAHTTSAWPLARMLSVSAVCAALALLPHTATAQQSAPPGGNTNPPLNTGDTSQLKSGGVSLGSLIVDGGTVFNGNVGVNNSSPASELDVTGTITADILSFGTNTQLDFRDSTQYGPNSLELIGINNLLQIIDSNNNTTNAAYVVGTNATNTDGANYTELFRVQEDGNVGIADSDPSQKLEVGGNISMSAGRHLYMGNQDLYGDNNSTLYFDSNDSSVSRFALRDADNDIFGSLYGAQGDSFGMLDGDGHWFLQHNKDSYTGFRVNNDEKMRITSGGNVGIGTTNPDSVLDIRDGNFAPNQDIRLQVGVPGGQWKSAFGIRSNSGGTARTYIDARSDSSGNSIEAISIDNNGNVGIGTTNPNDLLHVSNTSGDAIIRASSQDGGRSGIQFGDASDGATGSIYYEHSTDQLDFRGYDNAVRMTINSSGNVGIGDTTPDGTLKLDVEGQVGATEYCDEAGNNCIAATALGGGLWSENGTSAYYNTGNVGIGNSSPSSALDVNGDIELNAKVTFNTAVDTFIEATRVGSLDTLNLQANDTVKFTTGGGSERMRIDVDGNMGIGDTSPSQKLSVAGNIESTAGRHLYLGSQDLYGDNSQALYFDSNHANNSRFILRDSGNTNLGSLYGTDSGAFGLLDGNSNWILTGKNGNVGIGTTSPGSKLELYNASSGESGVFDAGSILRLENSGNNYIETRSPSSAYTGLLFTDNTAQAGGVAYAHNGTTEDNFLGLGAWGGISFHISSTSGVFEKTERMRIDQNGNVGIGTTAPDTKLHVAGGGSGALGALRISGGGGSSYWEIGRDNVTTGDFTFANNGTERVRIDTSGNVGIGTDSPGAPLDIHQTTAIGDTDGSETLGQLIDFELDTNQRIFEISTVRTAVEGAFPWYGTAIRLEANVDSHTNAQQWVQFGSGDGTGDNIISFGEGDGDSNEWMRIDNGNVGIGDTTPDGTLKLDVEGQVGATEYCDEEGNNCRDISTVGGESNTANIGSAGWYRIASNGPVADGGSGGNRASAQFTVYDTESSEHSAVTFVASYHYGKEPTINVLNRSSYNTDGLINKIRLVEGNTYEGAAVEIYVGGTGDVKYYMTDNNHTSGWTAEDWTAGSVPTGFAATQIDLDTEDPIFAAAASEGSNTFVVDRNANIQLNNPLSTGNHIYLGSQDLYGDDSQGLYFDSNHANNSRFVLRDSGNTNLGALYGTDSGAFGLLDGNSNWILTGKNGNVGIGTTNPGTYKLAVTDRIAIQAGASGIPALYLQADAGNSNDARIRYTGNQNFAIRDDTAGADRFRIYSSGEIYIPGNVGIGTTTPATKLAVSGNVGATNFCDEFGNNCVAQGDLGGGLWTENGSDIYYNSGNVGIGTSNPSSSLELAPGNNFKMYDANNAGHIFEQASDGTSGVVLRTLSNQNEIFQVRSAGQAVRFAVEHAAPTLRGEPGQWTFDSGNVGIGDTTPSQKLSVAGNIESTAGRHLYLGSQDLYGDNSQALYFDSNHANNSRFVLRDSGNTNLGALYGTDSGAFGLLDGNSNWILTGKNGNVGIGTTNPGAKLNIDGGNLLIENNSQNFEFNGVSGSNYVHIDVSGSGHATDRIHLGDTSSGDNDVTTLGNVGIGTTNPAQKLDVEGKLQFTTGGEANGLGTNANGQLAFYSNAVANDQVRMVIDDETGNVGIGTASPQGKLHIDGKVLASGSGGDVRFWHGSAAGVLETRSNTPLLIRTNSTEAMRVDTSGNVGIGTTNPNDLLHVSNTSGDAIIRASSQDGGRSGIQFGDASDGATGSIYYEHSTDQLDFRGYDNAVRMTINSSGNVGIGTTNPSEKLDVAGRVQATGFVQSSDESLKENITTIDNAERIMALRGVSFDWKSDGRSDYGFIAQEVEQIFPELVATNEHTGMKSVNYPNLIAIVLEYVKAQAEKIAELEQELRATNDRLDTLEARIEALEQ